MDQEGDHGGGKWVDSRLTLKVKKIESDLDGRGGCGGGVGEIQDDPEYFEI